MTAEAYAHLARVDPVMKRLIRRAPPCGIRARPRSAYESLIRAVAHQQLNGRAADTITRRFLALFPKTRFPSPQQIESVGDDLIRGAGFSRAKVAAIRDIAAKAQAGVVPHRRHLSRLSDDEIVMQLTECRGVGRWTVEMFLMFTLARPDVLPGDDFGIRNGFRAAYGRKEMPKPKELMEFGERWRPYRTTASWYLWRAVELAD